VAVQPLVLIALPMLLMTAPWRRLPGFVVRAAAPGALLLGAAAAANWSATYRAVTSQPNWPTVDKPTPWLLVPWLVRHLGDGSVTAGPARLLGIAVACGCALLADRGWRAARAGVGWDAALLADVLWWVAVAFALRVAFEPVMVQYYFWPVLAAALLAAAPSWPRLVVTSVIAAVLTFGSQVSWRGYLTWWAPVIVLLAATLAASRQSKDAGSVIPQETIADLGAKVQVAEFGQAAFRGEEREVAAPQDLPGQPS